MAPVRHPRASGEPRIRGHAVRPALSREHGTLLGGSSSGHGSSRGCPSDHGAIERRRREITLTWQGKLLIWVSTIAPRFVDWGLTRWLLKYFPDAPVLQRNSAGYAVSHSAGCARVDLAFSVIIQMISQTAASDKLRTVGSLAPAPAVARLTFLWCLVVSAWCGLVAGLLEVGAIVLRKELFDADHLYKMSRHFIWLIPLSNLCVFLVLGLVGYVLVLVWPEPRSLAVHTWPGRDEPFARALGGISSDLRSRLAGRGNGHRRAARSALSSADSEASGDFFWSVSRLSWRS